MEEEENPWGRRRELSEDCISGRIPLCSASIPIFEAQEALKSKARTHQDVIRIGDALLSGYRSSIEPKGKEHLNRLATLGFPDELNPLTNRSSRKFAEWIDDQLNRDDAPFRPLAHEYGDSDFRNAALLWIAMKACSRRADRPKNQISLGEVFPAPDQDGDLNVWASVAIWLLSYRRERTKAAMFKLAYSWLRDEKKKSAARASAVKKDRKKPVQEKAIALARTGKYRSVKQAADKIWPTIQAEAKECGWLWGERASDTFYQFLRKAVPELKEKKGA